MKIAEAPPIPTGIITSVLPEDVTWDIDWSETKPDGTRRYPDKPLTEEEFEPGLALALLLINEVMFINSHHWQSNWPEDARLTTYLGVNCNDLFAWAVADSEGVTLAELEDLYRMWLADPRWGASLWCIKKRRELPQSPVVKSIAESSDHDLTALAAEWNLRPNVYDGLSRVAADIKHGMYAAWCRDRNVPIIPRDSAAWCNGWRDFTAAIPSVEWNGTSFKTEFSLRKARWLQENGHG